VELVYLPVRSLEGVQILDPVEVYDYELQAFKLVYADRLSTEEAALAMGVSKATLWRMLDSCRSKLAEALAARRPIKIVSTAREPEGALEGKA